MEFEPVGHPIRSIRPPTAILACLAIVGALSTPAAAFAVAETETVVSSGDGAGDSDCAAGCTLREAIHDTNDGDADDDRIRIDLPALDSTILLGSQLPIITGPTTISDVSRFGSTITSNNTVNAFAIGAFNPGTDVSFNDLTIHAAGGSGVGAILTNSADLIINNTRITGSRATNGIGGGIILGSGTLVLQNSTVADNEATGADHHGGGIHAGGLTNLVIARSTISGNHTEDGLGGGIYTQGGLTLQSSTVSGNYTSGASRHGGGIASQFGGPINLSNSTVADNEARGIATDGGGVHTEGNAADPVLDNTIVADNRVGSFVGFLPDDLGSPDDTFGVRFSLVEGDQFPTPTVETVPGSNLIGIDPQLGGLAFNGGFNQTHRPAPSSPVVDQGKTITSQDQRLSPRPVDVPHVTDSTAPGADGADMGAVELALAEGPPVPALPTVTPPQQGDRTETTTPLDRTETTTPLRKRCAKKKGKRKKKGAVKRSAATAKKRRGCKKKRKQR